MLSNTRFNEDKTRFYMDSSEGLACYRGMMDANGEWQGTLVGIAKDETIAQRFLDGAVVDLRKSTKG